MIEAAKISILVFSILVTVGGVIGFLKAKSRASLFAGLLSGALLITCYSVANRNPQVGFLLGSVVTTLLIVTFFIRFKKTKKFMPAGLMLVFSLIEDSILALAQILPMLSQ